MRVGADSNRSLAFRFVAGWSGAARCRQRSATSRDPEWTLLAALDSTRSRKNGGSIVIQTSYDPEADVLQIRFGGRGAKYENAQEVAPGVYVEFDPAGRPIGIEVTSVSRHAVTPTPPILPIGAGSP